MNRQIKIQTILNQKTKTEQQLCQSTNLEEKIKLSYKIGEQLACIILMGKNIMEINEMEIITKELQVKQIIKNIKNTKIMKMPEDNTEYLLNLYTQLGLKLQWLKIVKQGFKQI